LKPDPEEVKAIEKSVSDIAVFFTANYPFLFIPLLHVNVYASYNIEKIKASQSSITINPKYWASLEKEEKRLEIAHQIMHVVLLHAKRREKRIPALWNFVCCAKANQAVEDLCGAAANYPTIQRLNVLLGENVEDYSAEEVYNILVSDTHASATVKGQVEEDLGEEEEDAERVLVRKGSGRLPGEAKEILIEARRFSEITKKTGTLPLGLLRNIDEIIEKKINWEEFIRAHLGEEKADTCFARINRRNPDLPGYEGYDTRFIIAVDTSGSITDKELSVFLGVVKNASKRGKVVVITWDAASYKPFVVNSPIQVKKQVEGGGGTMIAPALEKVLSIVTPFDGVVVLTDGEIYDYQETKTQRLFKRINQVAAWTLFLWTTTKRNPPGWPSLQLQIKE